MRVMVVVVVVMVVSNETRCSDTDLAIASSVGRMVDSNEFFDRRSIGGVGRWRTVVVA
jgi:hypothetical protein